MEQEQMKELMEEEIKNKQKTLYSNGNNIIKKEEINEESLSEDENSN